MADRRVLFDFLRKLKGDGVIFMFISHRNEEILEICDGVAVLRDGELVTSNRPVGEITSSDLSEMVLGRGLLLFARGALTAPARGEKLAWRLSDLSGSSFAVGGLEIRGGEIVGFAGLPGSGAEEVARAVRPSPRHRHDRARGKAQPLPVDAADALKSQHRIPVGGPAEGRRHGHSFDRQEYHHVEPQPGFRRAIIWPARGTTLVNTLFWRLSIKARDAEPLVGQLSGANQQRPCCCLACSPRNRAR
jgi:simple sugar transport system ATP-binding protein